MAQPDEMFERMIRAIPAREFVLRHLGRSGKPAFFDDRAVAEYVRCFTPKTIHGSCEDYRAAAGIDLKHDEADHQAGRKIAAPVLVMWGSRSHTGMFYGGDLVSIWREAATDVTGGPLDTGHYLAEEAPQAVALYSPQEVLTRKDFGKMAEQELLRVQRLIIAMAHQMATRLSRRKKAGVKARLIDPGRTMRRSLRYGGEVMDLVRRGPKLGTSVGIQCDAKLRCRLRSWSANQCESFGARNREGTQAGIQRNLPKLSRRFLGPVRANRFR